ncbi:Utp14 protein-domain-containing protein [Lanmaoa asiatica]|nr:Utp14 protein-domain-containing protein [Lanmaoa asiatica]
MVSCLWRLGLFVFLSSSVLAAEKPCTIHDSANNYYDLNPLKASKDYQSQTDGRYTMYLNVCGGVHTDPWNTGLDENQVDIAGLVRRDRGDFAIGLVNTTLEMKDGGLMLRQSQGSLCTGMDNERGSSTILFICDTSVYSSGSPVLLAQWPSEDDKACHYEFEWRTHYACPTGEHGFFGGLIVFLTISFMIILMAFIVISTVYNRFVLRLRGFDQLPKFTIAHAHEIWDVCLEFLRSLVDFVTAAWNTRSIGLGNVNSASHHWTSRDEEEALRTSDPLELDQEDVRGAAEGEDRDSEVLLKTDISSFCSGPIMARDIKSSKGPSKVHSFSRKHPDRARRKAHSQGKGKARAIDDVYEYAPSKVRRAKVALSLDRHETQGRRRDGSDDEMDLSGLGQEAMKKLRARLMRDDEGEDGDGRVDSEDDEDIDSEDAFEESDKDEFAGSEFVRKDAKTGVSRRNRASNRKRHVAKEVDLNEDSDAQSGDSRSVSENEDASEVGDEEMDEGSAGEFFDVLDKVDEQMRDVQTRAMAVEDEGEWKGAEDADVGMSGDEVGDEASDEEDEGDSAVDEDDELRISASDSEDPSPEALAELETFLSNLDPAASHKRKPDEVAEFGPKKRQRVIDRTEGGEESEFGVRGSSTLKLDDLLAPLASSSSLAALKKSTKPLTSSSSKTKTLSAPLPQRAQERLDREAAYEQTKEEVDKWSATMKRIKEAEHLSFPLQAEKPSRVSNLELAAKFIPSNELESAVDKLLKSAQLRDEDIVHTEALKMAHLSVEEVAARRAELRVMRELAFRADRKAKRIAKIKSKTYRRIRKKQREGLDGVGEGADGGADREDDEERLKAEVQRARERATLRHKNTGKWAKGMKGREGLDQDQRQAIGEMLERGEKLRRRIRGENSDDEGSEDTSNDEEEQDEEEIKRGAFEELAALRVEDDADLPDLKNKSVFSMKFMRDAAARQSREADAQAEELQKEMGFRIDGEDDDDGTDTVAAAPPKDTAMVQRTGGRLSFRPGTLPGALKPLGSLASDTSSVTLQSSDLLQDVPAPESIPTPSISTPTPTPTSIPNPWLSTYSDADTLTKSSNKLKRQTEKHEDERERARDDAVLEIDANNVLTIPEPPVPVASGKKRKGKARAREDVAKASAGPTNPAHDEGDGSDVPSEVEEQERAVEEKNAGKGVQAFKQRDLVALAFAGDNVVQAFEEAKRQETEADAPHEVDTTLPGWVRLSPVIYPALHLTSYVPQGTWGGTGTKKLPPKPHLIKSVPGITPNARADHTKPHLIISEKRDKKAAKYLVRELPYPYTSHAQFERRIEAPLGSEWNTRVGFQRGTLPRVVKKMGTVIDPLEKLF